MKSNYCFPRKSTRIKSINYLSFKTCLRVYCFIFVLIADLSVISLSYADESAPVINQVIVEPNKLLRPKDIMDWHFQTSSEGAIW